jgi:glycosyltransferase EpsE
MVKVSIIMGVYNAVNRVENAIHSITKQTFTDWELIICDDGSNDETYNVLKRYGQYDDRIIILQNNKNMGLATTLNNCLKLAKGEYIARMDDDDISHPTRLEKQVKFLDTNLVYSVVGTSRNLYDINGVWGKDSFDSERNNLDIFKGKVFIHPSVMIRRNVLEEVKGYSTNKYIGRTEDYDLWCKIYASGYKGYQMGEILLDYYEARDSYKRRRYIYRINECILKLKWRKKLKIRFRYVIFAFRPLVVGLLPASVLMKHHKKIYKM